MEVFTQWVAKYSLLIGVASLLTCIIVLILFCLEKAKLKKYRYLLAGSDGKNLEGLLLNISEQACIIQNKMGQLEERMSTNQVLANAHIQKLGFVRFQAFQNTGGDQSFALALLDGSGNGIVISSIFGREESRVYCKPVQMGVSSYPISAEEKEAIEKAVEQKQA